MKKRIKKFLLWTSILGVTVSSVSIPLVFYNNDNANYSSLVSKPDNVVKTSDVDYSKVSEYLNSFSQSKTSLQSFVSTNSKNSTSAPTLSDKEFETVKQKQNELLNFF